jgi:hypothetical protein
MQSDDADRYDDSTFWYDAFWRGRHLFVICPRFWGLVSLLADGAFHVDGTRPESVVRRTRGLYETMRLSGLPRGDRLAFTFGGATVTGAISDSDVDSKAFAGLNVAVTVSRDNRLEWIGDWARWHVRHHGLQAVLIFDNGSTATSIDAVRETLLRADVAHAAVSSVPLPYGPLLRAAEGRMSHAGQYLQTSLLNIARMRFLPRARAVLQCDVDELVRPGRDGIFDATVRSVLGLCVLSGSWRHPANGLQTRIRHREHVLASPDEPLCGGKYCVAPRGLLAGLSWSVHRLDSRYLSSRPRQQRWSFWHCSALRAQPKLPRGPLVCDPEAGAAFSAFPWSRPDPLDNSRP